ncbi:hypothetical protein BT67DRAFT_387069 [Trichocladium antarcticum]|uniref:Protein phosphatase n=1 Tax=Trichocladium antarcticum TaxID=1450529 RepID=A0AAN6UFS8_9PEZI|nr:hypothetical protein BT67DRAFT_387069 [Trichocladium antarcticum]
MRRLTGQLLAQASSHARLRPSPSASPAAVRSAIALHLRPALSTAWRRQHGQQRHDFLSPQRKPYLTASSSPTADDRNATSSRGAYPPLDADGRLDPSAFPKLPFRFDTGVALFAKRAPRPFPPPFLSPPSGSFSDALSTHDRSRDRRRTYVDGHRIQGFTNGDDAVFASDYFICANDGVGAWSTRPRGHAGLWARLIVHFWATAIFEDAARHRQRGGTASSYQPDPVAHLQRAYHQTIDATSAPHNQWLGTTTASGAQLHYRRKTETPPSAQNPAAAATPTATSNHDNSPDPDNDPENSDAVEPLLYVTNLGDSQVLVVRPATREVVYKTEGQWHWFDCPRQLGTNSPDTPRACAVVDQVAIREGDVVLAMSDGVIDNLWTHEIVEKVSESLESWRSGAGRWPGPGRGGGGVGLAGEDEDEEGVGGGGGDDDDGGMGFVAEELMEAARAIAVDPFAESPFMEHAIEEGLASHGGKLDDISVVAALCRRNDG